MFDRSTFSTAALSDEHSVDVCIDTVTAELNVKVSTQNSSDSCDSAPASIIVRRFSFFSVFEIKVQEGFIHFAPPEVFYTVNLLHGRVFFCVRSALHFAML